MDFYGVIEKTGMTIDGAGVAVIGAGAVIAFALALIRLARREADVYRRFREMLGRTILLGLELLVAGDIIRTVAAKPTLTSVAVLGAIVLIRTFLSFSLQVEVTGRWPWQSVPLRVPRLRAREARSVQSLTRQARVRRRERVTRQILGIAGYARYVLPASGIDDIGGGRFVPVLRTPATGNRAGNRPSDPATGPPRQGRAGRLRRASARLIGPRATASS
jgi:uncharacterized membrane protein